MAEEKKDGVKALLIGIGDTEVRVTVEQAKELYKALHEMFGERKVTRGSVVEHHYHRDYPWWPWRDRYWYGSSIGLGGATLQAQANSDMHKCHLGNADINLSSALNTSGNWASEVAEGIKIQNLLMDAKTVY